MLFSASLFLKVRYYTTPCPLRQANIRAKARENPKRQDADAVAIGAIPHHGGKGLDSFLSCREAHS